MSGPKPEVTVRVPWEVLDRLDAYRGKESRSKVIAEILGDYLHAMERERREAEQRAERERNRSPAVLTDEDWRAIGGRR